MPLFSGMGQSVATGKSINDRCFEGVFPPWRLHRPLRMGNFRQGSPFLRLAPQIGRSVSVAGIAMHTAGFITILLKSPPIAPALQLSFDQGLVIHAVGAHPI